MSRIVGYVRRLLASAYTVTLEAMLYVCVINALLRGGQRSQRPAASDRQRIGLIMCIYEPRARTDVIIMRKVVN